MHAYERSWDLFLHGFSTFQNRIFCVCVFVYIFRPLCDLHFIIVLSFSLFLSIFFFFLFLPHIVSPRSGIRKYVVWCLICGIISIICGIMFLGVYFLVRSYTSTIGYFETVPTFVPATLVHFGIFYILLVILFEIFLLVQ